MVNKIKRFFRSIGKPAGGSASLSSAFPVLASNDNQFYHQHELGPTYRSNTNNNNNQMLDSNNNMPVMMARSAAENSGSGSDSMASPRRSGGGDAIRWGLLLPRIPRLVAEATAVAVPSVGSASPSSSTAAAARAAAARDNSVEMAMLLEMLTQMAPKEAQTQILQFYIGDSSNSSATSNNNSNSSSAATVPVANWEQRKVFRQVRRALLLCWKFIIAQLNDNNAQLTSELRETYFQLIGLIAERIEFHLTPDSSPVTSSASAPSTSKSTPSRQQNNSGHMMGWTVHSPTASAPSPLANTADLSSDASGTTSSSATSTTSDDSVDGERDLYLYRCLLVATFKYVVENIDGAKASKRSWVTIAELQFFAKVLAICFFRIPVIQRLIIDQIYVTYRHKRWTNTATTATTAADDSRSTSSQPATPDSRAQRRRSSSRLSSGLTFTGSLSRWSEFEGHVLSEVTSSTSSTSSSNASAYDDSAPPRDPATPSSSSATSPAASLPTRAAVDKFKRMNPTLFRWTRYAPYLTPYTDTDVFRMNDTMKLSWLEKLSHDGEFFALFMSSYAQHAETCAGGDTVVWSALPAYALLVRVALLLLKEASWAKWLYMRDNTVNSTPSSLYDSPSAGARIVREPFELRSIRSIRAVLDSVVHWLRNRELLESCTLALMECTNVLHPRSVGVCLTRCEEWFRATAVPVSSDSSSDQQVAYRLPSSFSGLTFALGIRLMLSSESFETLTRTLQFLYDCLAYFDGELRQHVLKALVQRHMFLFLHWHADVRSAYHHVLVYKLTRVNRFFLDSPIDHLLIGRHAVLQFGNGDSSNSGTSSSSSGGAGVAHGFDDFDDHLSGGAPYANVHSNNSSSGGTGPRPFQISAAEFSALRTEQALWRAFDACISAICVHERRNAKDGNRKYQYELQCARSRAVAFQKLTRATVDDLAPSSSVNEGLPGGKPWLELDLLEEELHREPPYYLRYLPAEDVSSIDELRRLASTLRYPLELHVYAAASLRHYSDLLKKYYEALSRNKYVEAPPLGFA